MNARTIFTCVFALFPLTTVFAADAEAPAAAPPASAANDGQHVEVAIEAAETRNQTWASVAWNAGAQCWLVVWREGYLNEQVSDIWCARVSAEGKALDPAGVRLTTGTGVKDMPRVASDGHNFLVIWDDFRNGSDWDVYATRVSGKGMVLDKEPILIAGGDHNQCRPGIAFAKNNYFVVWMAYVDGLYGIYGVRVSPKGTVIGPPVDVAVWGQPKNRKAKPKQSILPVVAANDNGELLTACYVPNGYKNNQHLARRVINADTGEPVGELTPGPKSYRDKNTPGLFGWYRERCSFLTMGPENAMMVSSGFARSKSKNDVSACLMSKTGDIVKLQELGSSLTSNDQFKPLMPRPTTAFDGTTYLVVSDCPTLLSTKRSKDPRFRCRLIGWRIAGDGTVENADGFVVAGDKNLDCMLPAAAAGPDGAILVVYSEVRGVDNVKVLARVMK